MDRSRGPQEHRLHHDRSDQFLLTILEGVLTTALIALVIAFLPSRFVSPSLQDQAKTYLIASVIGSALIVLLIARRADLQT